MNSFLTPTNGKVSEMKNFLTLFSAARENTFAIMPC